MKVNVVLAYYFLVFAIVFGNNELIHVPSLGMDEVDPFIVLEVKDVDLI